MSLADFEIRKEDVMYRGVVATTVRGIALRDITSLLHGHLADLNTVFAAYKAEANNDIAMMKAATFALKMVNDVPDLVESIVIAATDEVDTPELRAKLRKLPIGLMAETLRKIIEITTEDAGGAKKLFDSLVGMAQTIRPVTMETPQD
jgi:hypothetical protein